MDDASYTKKNSVFQNEHGKPGDLSATLSQSGAAPQDSRRPLGSCNYYWHDPYLFLLGYPCPKAAAAR